MPPFSPEQIAFLEGPNSLVIATQDGNLVPEVTRAVALRCQGSDQVVVWLPARIATRAVANLKHETRIAVGVSRPSSHKSLQLKGRVLRVAEAATEAQANLERAFEAFIQEAGTVGLPARLLHPVVRWPVVEVTVEVMEIYDQTPGPGAGERCAS
jgi:hypothetical protein